MRPVLETEEAIAKLVSHMRNLTTGVEITDRRFRLKTYPACFIGSEAVDWLFKNVPAVTSRDDAVIIGQYLLNKGVFCHVLQEHSFCDGMRHSHGRVRTAAASPLPVPVPDRRLGGVARRGVYRLLLLSLHETQARGCGRRRVRGLDRRQESPALLQRGAHRPQASL